MSAPNPPVWKVPLSETTLGEDEAVAAAEVVRSGWLTQGARTQAFERAFAESIQASHAIAVANCTLGLELAFHAVGVTADTEVIVPALTFVATANAAVRLGAQPVFADIVSTQDLTLDPSDVARRITPRTKAVCVVHYAGFAAQTDALRALCDQHGLALVEDCAHAPGTRVDGTRYCGTLGDVAAFSFFSNKNMTTGEGGMITTQRADLAARIRAARSHGMTTTTWDRHRGHAFTYDVLEPGTNARLDEIRSQIGLIQLAKLTESNRTRALLVQKYRASLGSIEGLEIPFLHHATEVPSHHLFVVLLPTRSDRQNVMTVLRDHGVQSSIHYPPSHQFTAYNKVAQPLPITDAVAPRLLTLPLFPTMTDAQHTLVCNALRAALT